MNGVYSFALRRCVRQKNLLWRMIKPQYEMDKKKVSRNGAT